MNLIYYQDDKIIVRNMEEKDADSITKSEINQGFNVSVDQGNSIYFLANERES